VTLNDAGKMVAPYSSALLLPAIASLGAALQSSAAPATGPATGRANTPLFSTDFSTPLDVVPEASLLGPNGSRVKMPSALWVIESQGHNSTASTASGNLTIANRGSHCVLWLNRRFPPQIDIRFSFMPVNVTNGLAIVFFSAAPPNATATGSIFDLSLPPRHGDYANYFNGLATYSDSYFRPDGRTGPGDCDRNATTGLCIANLRKDPGFHLVASGNDLVGGHRPANGRAFEVRVVRLGGQIVLSVDGAPEVTWTDPSPLGGGYIGLRQMSNTGQASYTHLDVYPASA